MLNIVIAVVYDQGTRGNEALCRQLLAATEERRLTTDDPSAFESYRAFPSLTEDHEVAFIKIIPPGQQRPPSDGLLQRQLRAVEYATQGEYDERARNFGLSRGFGYNHADALLEVDNAAALVAPDLGRREAYAEQPWGRLTKREAFEKAGLLREDVPVPLAREQWRERVNRVEVRHR